MTARSVATLKGYFTTGFKPTQSQFGDVMDSFVSFLDTSAQSIVSDFYVSGAVVLGSPTGGNKGIGTLNAVGLYVNGTLITTTSAGGSGTVNLGAANQIAYYPASMNSVSGTNALPNGTTATTQTAGDASTKICTNAYVDRGTSGASAVLLSNQIAANSASISFLNIPQSGYDHFELRYTGGIPVSSGAFLQLQLSSNNGSTWLSGSSFSADNHVACVAGTTGGGGYTTGGGNCELSNIAGSTALPGVGGRVTIIGLSNASSPKVINYDAGGLNSSSQYGTVRGTSVYNGSNVAVNAIQIIMSTGNISSGSFALYGIRNS